MAITVPAKDFISLGTNSPEDISHIKMFLLKKDLKGSLTSDFPFFSREALTPQASRLHLFLALPG